MDQAEEFHTLDKSSGEVESLRVIHKHQASESLPYATQVPNVLTNPSAREYQQLMSAYQSLQLERDMLRKALRSFHIAKIRPHIS